ncbi:MAG: hypothetical protein ACRD2L_02380 [Terriglobia bacterium]
MGWRQRIWLGIWVGFLLSTTASDSHGLQTFAEASERRAASPVSGSEEERDWSRRFLEAKTRLRELREEDDGLSRKLSVLRNFSCGAGEDAGFYHNPYLVAKTEKQFEVTRKNLDAAEQALAGLRESLRRSGKPVSWQDSRLAIEQPERSVPTAVPAVKDEGYWRKQLSTIDKRYDYLIEPLRVELFELSHLRAPNPGEDITGTGSGICIPFYSKIQQQIKELQQQHQEERAALMEQGRREGALPGWFR